MFLRQIDVQERSAFRKDTGPESVVLPSLVFLNGEVQWRPEVLKHRLGTVSRAPDSQIAIINATRFAAGFSFQLNLHAEFWHLR